MLWKNCVLIVVFLYGVLCQDTNPEWLEPNTTTTTPTTTISLPTTTTTTNQPTESIPTTTITTTPNQPTERTPTTTYPTTRYPTTRYPTTKYPTTRYPTTGYRTTPNQPTRYPPTPSPTQSTTKPPQDMCIVSLSKPTVQYYSFFGLIYKSITQCCYLCCFTKFSYEPYCTKIPMQKCNLNANKYNSYDYGY